MNTPDKFRWTLELGDWSGDGHGHHQTINIESNKDVGAAQKAYQKVKKELSQQLCPEKICSEYQEHKISNDVIEAARKLGFDFQEGYDEEQRAEHNEDGGLYLDLEKLADYTLWFIKRGDPEIELKITPREEMPSFNRYARPHISFIGYGLFGD